MDDAFVEQFDIVVFVILNLFQDPAVVTDEWTLNQVQGDNWKDVCFEINTDNVCRMSSRACLPAIAFSDGWDPKSMLKKIDW